MAAVAFPLTDELTSSIEYTMRQVRQSLVQVRNGHAGAGAGIILSPEGRILTNNHVLGNSRGGHHVILRDSEGGLQAEVLVCDPDVDLAILRIEQYGLPGASIGDSRHLQVGQLVFAIGHPWRS